MVAQTALDNGVNIYDVSKMLAHQRVATTEARYIEGSAKQAAQAQEIFSDIISDTMKNNAVVNNEYNALRKIYLNAEDEIINKIMDMMK